MLLTNSSSVVQQIHTDKIKENVSLSKQREQKTREGNTVFFTIIHNEFIPHQEHCKTHMNSTVRPNRFTSIE